MRMNGITVIQHLHTAPTGHVLNEYRFFTDRGICLGGVLLPADDKHMADTKTLDSITKLIATRWGALSKRRH